MKIFDLIGKTITGVAICNQAKDSTTADSVRLTFSDNSELHIDNEYLDGYGWTVLNIEMRKNEPL